MIAPVGRAHPRATNHKEDQMANSEPFAAGVEVER